MATKAISETAKAAGFTSKVVKETASIAGLGYNAVVEDLDGALESGVPAKAEALAAYLKPAEDHEQTNAKRVSEPETQVDWAVEDLDVDEEPESDWGNIEFGSTDTAEFPAPGWRLATIVLTEVFDSAEALYLKMTLHADGFDTVDIEEFETIAGKPGTEAAARAKQGRRLLYRLGKA